MTGAAGALDAVHRTIERYYSQKILAHGPTPAGVDWACDLTQQLRFVQLLKLCKFGEPFSINDVGCGYGALLDFLAVRHHRTRVRYAGVDLSPAMIEQARRMHPGKSKCFQVGHLARGNADYSVASGIFNVKLDQPFEAWERFVEETLAMMHARSRRGFAVNFLAPLADGTTGEPQLYRAQPARWRDHCRQVLGARVSVIRNYGLREYSLLIRR